MKKNRGVDKLRIMSNRHLSYLSVAATALLLLLFSGCNALNRGDYFRQSDDSLYFSEIGFLMADNPGLSRDAVTHIEGFEPEIWITVPYSTDTTSPLVINFDVVGKDTVVKYENPPGSNRFFTLVSGLTPIVFNNGSTPLTYRLRISKQDSSGNNLSSRDFWVHVDKIIRPVLYNPPSPGETSPFDDKTSPAFRFSFEDEDGTLITGLNTQGADPSTISWDWRKMKFITDPVYDAGPPEGFVTDVEIYYPGEHQISISSGMYTDSQGYQSLSADINFSYDPPPVYLSQSGNDNNNGLTASTPVKTWTKAYSIAKSSGIFHIFIEASDTPYDVGESNLIDGDIKAVSIFGNWKPGFSDRYEEDMDHRTPTILTNSLQDDGSSLSNPSAVLAFVSVSSDFILDGVTLEPSETISNGSALKLDNSFITVSDCRFISPRGNSTGATAVTVTNSSGDSSPQFYDTRITGKSGGSGDSTGMRIYGSRVDFSNGYIAAGDISGGNVTGIYAESSTLNLYGNYVLAGRTDPENDTYTEQNNKGISSRNSYLNISGVFVHAADSSSISEAAELFVDAGEENPSTRINTSTLVSGDSGTSTTLYASNEDAGRLYLYNSVLLAGKADVGSSTGIFNDKMEEFRIMGNAIHVSKGKTPADSYGIRLTSVNTGNPDIRNNLIWSTDSSQSLGIKLDEDYTASPFPIKNNDFWNTSGPAQLDVGDGKGPENLADIQAGNPTISGNFGIPVDVDIDINYSNPDSSHQDIGRINGTVSPDVMFGGENLSSLSSPPPNYDRAWNQRTGEPGLMLGWSVGPFEYDDDSFPQVIYVSADDAGDDSHPLGTAEAPFSSLARAYEVARTASTPRNDVTEIRIAEGRYNMNNPPMPDINRGPDIRILGGYDKLTWNRDPALYTTELFKDDGSPVLTFDDNYSYSVSRETLLEGFTLKNTNTSVFTQTVLIDNGSSPEIRNNTIIGGNFSNSRGLDINNNSTPLIDGNTIIGGTADLTSALYVDNNASPVIRNNIITGGNYNAGTTFALNINGNTSPAILSNEITGGNSSISYGVRVNGATPYIGENTISGGEALPGGTAYGLELQTARGTTINDNDISGGSGLNTYGIYSNNSEYLFINDNRIDAGSATGRSYGLFIDQAQDDTIDANHIFGGAGSGSSYGIYIINGTNTTARNNVIHGGSTSGSDSCGIYLEDGDSTMLAANNTIYGGKAVNATYALFTAAASRPSLINNIFIAGNSNVSDYAVYEDSENSVFQYFNNLLLAESRKTSVPHRAANGISYHEDDVKPLEDFLGGASKADGTLIDEESPYGDYFVKYLPGNTYSEFLNNNDWHLKTGSRENPRTGGRDLPGIVDYDMDGNPRTSPWSIGAYEY